MSAETMKMPEPIMLPATSMVESNSPSRCRSPVGLGSPAGAPSCGLVAVVMSLSPFGGNPKSESRNPKQIPNPESQNPKRRSAWFRSFGIRILYLFRISDFGFRIYRLAVPRLAAGGPRRQRPRGQPQGDLPAPQAAPVAVTEVDEQAQHQPDHQPQPGLHGQEKHHRQVDQDPQRGHDIHRGAAERP